jgi:hypothetical protein
MKKNLGILAILSLCFLSIFAFNDSASVGVLTISPTAVRPSDYLSNSGFWYADPDEFYFTDYRTTYEVYVPINLPHKVQIEKFVAYLSDGTGRWESLTVYLERQSLKSGKVDVMASVSTGLGLEPLHRVMLTDDTIDNAKIKNQTHSYHLRLVFNSTDPSLKFHGAKIIF